MNEIQLLRAQPAADSIHGERALYGRVRAALPAGLALE
jgi:hypothetical protein